MFYSEESLEDRRQRIEAGKEEAGIPCRIEIHDGAIYEIIEGARLHFVKFETRQIEKCLDYVRDTIMMSDDFKQVHLMSKAVMQQSSFLK
jgi:hypothetical protein